MHAWHLSTGVIWRRIYSNIKMQGTGAESIPIYIYKIPQSYIEGRTQVISRDENIAEFLG